MKQVYCDRLGCKPWLQHECCHGVCQLEQTVATWQWLLELLSLLAAQTVTAFSWPFAPVLLLAVAFDWPCKFGGIYCQPTLRLSHPVSHILHGAYRHYTEYYDARELI